MGELIITFFLFFIISYFLQSWTITKLKKWFLDNPNYRSLHQIPKPSGGGLVFVILGSIGAWYLNFLVPLFCVPLSIVGLVDDRFNISRKIRYLFQFSTVVVLINISPLKIEVENIVIELFLQIILIIFLTAIINFTNFMDGIDGLVAGSMTVYFSLFVFLLNPSLLPLIASLIAFLIFNWNPAKVFMGDVGSTFLGALFAGLLLQFPSWIDSLKFLIIASPLFLDALFCILRRIFERENIFRPHRKHLYQRLIGQKGLTHAKVSIIYIGSSLINSIFLYLQMDYIIIFNLIFIILIGFYLDRLIAKPFKIS